LILAWLYLLNAVILAVLAGFLWRMRMMPAGPYGWFMLWLYIGVVTNVLLFVSRAVPDATVSLSFWLAGYASVVFTLLVLLLFVRSFEGGSRFSYLLWTLPALFAASFILLGGSAFSLRDEGVWRFDLARRSSLVPRTIMVFYALAAVGYLAKLYVDVRGGGSERSERGVRYLLIAVAVMFLTNAASPFVRQYVSPLLPVGEVGFTLGALIIALDLSWLKLKRGAKEAFF